MTEKKNICSSYYKGLIANIGRAHRNEKEKPTLNRKTAQRGNGQITGKAKDPPTSEKMSNRRQMQTQPQDILLFTCQGGEGSGTGASQVRGGQGGVGRAFIGKTLKLPGF